jgi:S-DNA-T family DNA segregation ATPase FtsK/SpoIIIE
MPTKKIEPLKETETSINNNLDEQNSLYRLKRISLNIIGVLIISIALMTFLGLFFIETSGKLLSWWVENLQLLFGWGSIWIDIGLLFIGIWLLRFEETSQHGMKINWGKLIAFEFAGFASMTFFALVGGISFQRASEGLDGGIVGWGLAELLRRLLLPLGVISPLVMYFIVIGILVLSLIVLLQVGAKARRLRIKFSSKQSVKTTDLEPAVSEAPMAGDKAVRDNLKLKKKRRIFLPQQFKKNFKIDEEKEDSRKKTIQRDERLPDLSLLVDEKNYKPDERNINQTAGLIEKTLAEFGIPAKVIGFRVGPTITQFAVEPGYVEKEKDNSEKENDRHKVRVAQIASLHKDLALALSAERVRIEAPVPGRPYVGIEVPNPKSSIVRLRPILESDDFYSINSPLALALGRDVSGKPVVADLKIMPHLLIAGTTGSGKSVSILAITLCLVMNNTPEDLRLVMIDPKMVELIRLNGLPHLLGRVETDLKRIMGVLQWVVAEMDNRYKLLEVSRSRNIDTYNRKARRRKEWNTLPRIVLIIDELADLMMLSPDQTEHSLVRLAQMARATGIHLVVATQRPSTDVVTGLIKANFPARISFTVASSVDSRVILDTAGAENLLGQGDMLFMAPDAPAPIRAQGVMVSDQEIERVISYWQNNIDQKKDEIPPWEEVLKHDEMMKEKDSLLEAAITVVQESQRASASMLQRKLHIGYPRAARLIDELEELGIVGPAVSGGRERDVLIEPRENEE